ncbi:MAG: hypothetical protein D0530_10885 [Methylococcales bacterium]|jgi:hypothetical protein|nr:MAG: hypothetical protein D0530_10885 [Methylococcales bacterium]
MLKKLFIVLLLLLLLIWLYDNLSLEANLMQRQPTKLEAVGAKCLDLSERSVASVTPIIEYQRLELISRQSYALSRCMIDRGYIENAAWRTGAEQHAVGISQQQKISISEALETLRRKDMTIFNVQNQQASYWMAKK